MVGGHARSGHPRDTTHKLCSLFSAAASLMRSPPSRLSPLAAAAYSFDTELDFVLLLFCDEKRFLMLVPHIPHCAQSFLPSVVFLCIVDSRQRVGSDTHRTPRTAQDLPPQSHTPAPLLPGTQNPLPSTQTCSPVSGIL